MCSHKVSTGQHWPSVVVVVVVLFYVHVKHLRSCRDGQLTNHTFPGQA